MRAIEREGKKVHMPNANRSATQFAATEPFVENEIFDAPRSVKIRMIEVG